MTDFRWIMDAVHRGINYMLFEFGIAEFLTGVDVERLLSIGTLIVVICAAIYFIPNHFRSILTGVRRLFGGIEQALISSAAMMIKGKRRMNTYASGVKTRIAEKVGEAD